MDIEGEYDAGFTALFKATVWGNCRAVEQLLRLGANPDMGISHADEKKRPPIPDGAAKSYVRCTRLNAGANVDSPGLRGLPYNSLPSGDTWPLSK